MNFIKCLLLTGLFFAQINILSAQCADLYFYRMTGLQSTGVVTVQMEGQDLFGLDLGHRTKTTICTEGEYIFSVRIANGLSGMNKASVKVKAGNEYYFKVTNAIGVGLPTIDLQNKEKGRKDINKNGRFTQSLTNFSMPGNIALLAGGQNAVTGNQGGFQKVQIVNNFRFEIVDIVKAGQLIVFNYKITNLAPDDRKLMLSTGSIYFYDDLGQLVFSNKICIANQCSYSASGRKQPKGSFDRGSSNYIADNTMPAGIPLNAEIIIKGINNRASKFVRGIIWCKAEQEFKFEYKNIEFPKVIDPNNPMKRNFGQQSIELKNANQDGNSTVFKFAHFNGSPELVNFKLLGGEIYDDTGEKHAIDALSFVGKNNPINKKRKNWDWNKNINGNSNLDVYLFCNTIKSNATQIRRITLNFEGFTLSWENIPLQKGGTATLTSNANSNYTNYSDFESKVNRNENVIGKKVILEKINFTTGSDNILSASHTQLDQLANLMNRSQSLKLEISGHTDNIGDEMSNMLLSQKRADAIKYYLIGKSVDPARISSIGKGEKVPIKSNATAIGRKENRRVEIMVTQ